MNMKRISLNSILTVPAVLGFCLLAVSCESNNLTGPDDKDGMVALNFTAAVGKPQVAETRKVSDGGMVEGTGFPNGHIGMFINKAPGGGEVFQGSQKMKVQVQLGGSALTYRSHDENQLLTPKAFSGRKIGIAAYYPWQNNADADGVPFDFTGNMDEVPQQDLLYYGKSEYTVPVTTNPGQLIFKHAYARIKVNVRKSEEKGVDEKLSSVSIDNLGGEWIKNKGKIDPATGMVKEGGNIGSISSYGFESTLATGSDHAFEFLVPAFMGKNVNENVAFLLMINGKRVVFPLKKENLNHEVREDGVYYGFAQGYTNTYNLVYDNSELKLLLIGWTSIENSQSLGEPAGGGSGGVLLSYPNVFNSGSSTHWGGYPTDGSLRDPNNSTTRNYHLYETYLSTVALGNNGVYVDGNKAIAAPKLVDGRWSKYNFDKNVYMDEPPYAQIYVTSHNLTREPVVWENENGGLIAKEICRRYRGGGHSNWRLPRASELRMLAARYVNEVDTYEAIMGRTEVTDVFWTATERDADHAWTVRFETKDNAIDPVNYPTKKAILAYNNKKNTLAYIRCVRDKSDIDSSVVELYKK